MPFNELPGPKISATPWPQRRASASGITPPPNTSTSSRPRSRSSSMTRGNRVRWAPAEQRQADGVGVFLQRGLGDLLGRLMQAGVDHLEPVVAQRPGDGLRAAVVAVETGLGNHDAIGALHEGETLRRRPRTRPNGATAAADCGGADDGCSATDQIAIAAGPSGRTGARRDRRDRGDRPVHLGHGGLHHPRRWHTVGDAGADRFQVGSTRNAANIVAEDGPIMFPGLMTTTRRAHLHPRPSGRRPRHRVGGLLPRIRSGAMPRARSSRSSARARSPIATATRSTSPTSLPHRPG